MLAGIGRGEEVLRDKLVFNVKLIVLLCSALLRLHGDGAEGSLSYFNS